MRKSFKLSKKKKSFLKTHPLFSMKNDDFNNLCFKDNGDGTCTISLLIRNSMLKEEHPLFAMKEKDYEKIWFKDNGDGTSTCDVLIKYNMLKK